jgi:hypothetical protein
MPPTWQTWLRSEVLLTDQAYETDYTAKLTCPAQIPSCAIERAKETQAEPFSPWLFLLQQVRYSTVGGSPTGAIRTGAISYRLAAESFLDGLAKMAKANELEAGIDAVLEYFNSRLSASSWQECDLVLSAADPACLPEEFVVALLSSTTGAKGRLRSRPAFFTRCERFYVASEGREVADEILTGLR